MTLTDILLATIIFGGAVYFLYRFVWGKKEHCPGCGGSCGKIKDKFLL